MPENSQVSEIVKRLKSTILIQDSLLFITKKKNARIPKTIRRAETYLALDSVPVECQNLDTNDELCKEYKKNVKRRMVTKVICLLI